MKNLFKMFHLFQRLLCLLFMTGLAGHAQEAGSLLIQIAGKQVQVEYQLPADRDGNGLPDAWEQQHFGHAGVDPNADPDGDGLTNLQEYQQGTNPAFYDGSGSGGGGTGGEGGSGGSGGSSSDSDSNGLPDSWEIQYFGHIGINQSADSDGDGRSNLQELQNGTDPTLPENFGNLGNYIAIEIPSATGQLDHFGDWGMVVKHCEFNNKGELLRTVLNYSPEQGFTQSYVVWNPATGVGPIDPTISRAWAINDKSEIAGGIRYSDSTIIPAIFDKDGAVIATAGGTPNEATMLNNNGGIAGISPSGWWINSVDNLIPGAAQLSAMNDEGDVAGVIGEFVSSLGSITVWRNGGTIVNFPSAPFGRVTDMNNLGQVIGWASDGSDDNYFFIWNIHSNTVTRLPLLEGENPWSFATAINNHGVVVGASGNRGVYWLGGKCYDAIKLLAVPISGLDLSYYDASLVDCINDSSQMIVTFSSSTDGEYRKFLFTSPQLAVDADRDGTIKLASEDASDATSAENPYRFWLNDDIDVLVESTIESEEDDRDPDSFLTIVNWESNFISSHRDLEDFARMWINTQGLSDALKPKADGTADLYLGLQWADTEGTTPSIKIYKHVEPEGGTEYLNNPDVAQQQVNGALAIIDASGQRTNRLVDGTTPYILPSSLFSDLTAAKTKTCLLFEGCKIGKGQLKLVILDKNKQPIGEGPGVWMDLKEPKEFIQRWTCGDADLGSVNPVALDASKSGAFLPPTTDEEKDLILYVHGYNMEEFLKQRWIETTFKRLYWLGYKGHVGGFTWPCSQSALPFDASEENAYKAGAQLHALLNTLKDDGYRVHLLGHSQGNVVVGEALRQAGPDSAVAATYIASQAAIPAHCYDAAQPERSGPVAFVPTTANVYRSFYTGTEGENPNLPKTWSADDPAYLAQSQLNGSVGKFVNFFNPQDYALSGNGISLLADDGSQPGWLVDQRLKPNLGWRYNDNEGFFQMTGPAQSPTITYLSAANPTQRYQIFAYGAQARSLALGASTGMGGVFAGSVVNLFDAPYNFRNQHIYHSGQFRSFYAQRWQYWQQLLFQCNLHPRDNP